MEGLYGYADTVLGHGRLDQAMASVDVATLGQALEGYFQFLRNRPNVSEARWRVAIRFTIDVLTRLTKSSPHSGVIELQRKLAQIELLYAQLRVGRQRKPVNHPVASVRGRRVVVRSVRSSSSSNPFRKGATRWRVYTTYILLLHLGLRRGELLSLAADAIMNGFDRKLQRQRYWLTVRYNPSRR